ncbi:hypothetical protein ACFSQT_12005 [Mesorhizobium calcicola]|uniref:Uncharacterized protein n=1 Tax=Mesorhizobium calcicola TaxID=1300310 RepID=A0ABW4WDW9_9HYPH
MSMLINPFWSSSAAAPIWSPLSLGAALLGWYKADEITGSNNDPLSAWADGSGHSNDMTQATSGARPTLITANLNGKNVVRFNAPSASQYFDVPNIFSGKSAGSMYLVIKKNADPAGAGGANADEYSGIHRFGSSTGTATAGHMTYTDSNIYSEFGTTVRKSAGNPTPSLALWRIISIHSAASDYGIFIDGGVYVAGSPTPFFSTATNTVGFDSSPKFGRSVKDPTGTPVFKYMEGWAGEVLLIDGKLSTANQQNVEGYLAATARWALQANLDAAHPYKSSPPPA